MTKIQKISEMSYEDKAEAVLQDTHDFINHIDKLTDEPGSEDPFHGPYAAFGTMSICLLAQGWSVKELLEVLEDNALFVAQWDAEDAMDSVATHASPNTRQ